MVCSWCACYPVTWIYLAMSAAALLSASDRVPMLHSAASHGKLLSLRGSAEKKISSWMYVPKLFFGHFYAVGLTVSSLCIVGLYFGYDVCFGLSSSGSCGVQMITGHLSSKDAIFVLGLLWLHETRRLYECIFVHRWSHGLMSLLAYSVGMLHYILAPFAVLCEVEIETESSSSVERWKPGLGQLIGAILFVVASVVQHNVHTQLAELRMEKSTTSHHQPYKLLPHQGFFRRVSCPHYTAEIVLYFGLFLIAKMGGGGGIALCSMLCFVVSNLSVNAYRMHAWYERTFGEAFKAHRRARLLPGLW